MSLEPSDEARPGRLPSWRLLDLGRCAPARAQAFVEAVAVSVGEGRVPNTLVLAQPSAPYLSLGFHQSFHEELDPGFLERRRIPVLRRVEGGGTTYLDPDQWFFQLAYRDEGGGRGGPEDLKRFLRGPVAAARSLGLSAELRAPSDLVVGGRKVSGNAGGDWEGAHLVVGGFLLGADVRAMADALRLPHPALRPLLRGLVAREVTSWEEAVGVRPPWERFRQALASAIATEGRFEARTGAPTPAEEARFLEETLPRHSDPAWRELPPAPRRAGSLVRRLRIAGPHGLLVFRGSGEHLAAIVDGDRLVEAYRVGDGPTDALEELGEDGDGRAAVAELVASTPSFA